MSFLCPIFEPEALDVGVAGGKGSSLARMVKAGLAIPKTFVLTTPAYDLFLRESHLQEKISLELGRKDFADMRWEEIWDASLRIRNLFLRASFPTEIEEELVRTLPDFGGNSLAVRSSAPAEDGAGASFAGLHESFVNVCGSTEILQRIRLVWASLWSDAALLYRQELGLDPADSTMAVLIQELVHGHGSGVLFTQNPNAKTEAVVEAVYGLNQGLVDGDIEPDRWYIVRDNGVLREHEAPVRQTCLWPDEHGGVRSRTLRPDEMARPPVSEDEVARIFHAGMLLEKMEARPQDVEWTYRGPDLILLQARPITTASVEGDEDRQWYLSLRRGFENLQALREKVENVILPEMDRVASGMAEEDPGALLDGQLAEAILERGRIYEHWHQVYWDDCIPLAHGIRLFGQVYNDMVQPEDPYEFVGLLRGKEISGLDRNEKLESLAAFLCRHPEQRELLGAGLIKEMSGWFRDRILDYRKRFGDPVSMFSDADSPTLPDPVIAYLMRLSGAVPSTIRRRTSIDSSQQESGFLDTFPIERREEGVALLELARASYRLRDDDNIYLGRIDAEVKRFRSAATARLHDPGRSAADAVDNPLTQVMVPVETQKGSVAPRPERVHAQCIEARQLKGQPASQGMCTGTARVIRTSEDLLTFERGEILVCDAIDPNMTFLVPLAAGIVERRGGMLIHGAIIAREYGLPCITGIPDATNWIRNGDRITLDGYLGIVTVQQHEERAG